jgi:hypothetical protein
LIKSEAAGKSTKRRKKVNKRSVSIFKEKEDRKATISLPRLLILGLCFSLSVAATVQAQERQVTGFSSFHVTGPLVPPSGQLPPYECLGESWGAVINNCTYDVSLAFNLPIDNPGNVVITLQDYWGTWPGGTFTCSTAAVNGLGSSGIASWGTFFTNSQPIFLAVDPNASQAILVNCGPIPPGAGISKIAWTL